MDTLSSLMLVVVIIVAIVIFITILKTKALSQVAGKRLTWVELTGKEYPKAV